MAAFCMEVAHSPAVSHHEAVKSPLLAKDLDQKLVAAAARFAFIRIICAHHLLHVSGLDQLLECIKICLIEVSP